MKQKRKTDAISLFTAYMKHNQWDWLPTELHVNILLESVVDTALDDSNVSLSDSTKNHALVCRAWESIVTDLWFKRRAKERLYTVGIYAQYTIGLYTNEIFYV